MISELEIDSDRQENEAINPKTVLFVETGRLGGGSFEGLVLMLTVLDPNRYRPVVVFTSKSRHFDQIKQMNVPVHLIRDPVLSVNVNRRFQKWMERIQEYTFCRIPSLGKIAAAFCHRSLLHQLEVICKNESVDLLYSNNQVNRSLFMPILAERLDLPLVVHLRSPGAESFCQPKRAFVQRWATRWIAISEQVKNYWLEHGLSAPVEVIPNGLPEYSVDPINLYREFSVPKDHNIVVIISRLVWEKAHDFLLEGFADMLERRPKTTLLIVGDGPRRERIEKQIEDMKLGSNVIMVGHDDRAHAIAAAADLLAQPSSTDSLSRAVMEAMILRTPTVISDMGSALEAITPNVHSIVTAYRDVPGLSKALETGLYDENMRTILVTNARLLMDDRFNLKKQTKKIELIMNAALLQGPGPY